MLMLIFFQSISSLNTKYFNIDDNKTTIFETTIFPQTHSVPHNSIRRVQKNFEHFQEFFKTLKFNFRFNKKFELQASWI